MDFRLPELGEGVYEAELTGWLVKAGAVVKRGQNLLEVMTDKATMEVPSPFNGTISSLLAEPGQTLKIGQVVLTYTGADEGNGAAHAKGEARAAPQGAVANKVVTVNPRATPLTVKASPSVRQLAHKLGIDLTRVKGSGPGGRVLLEDLQGNRQVAPTQAKPPGEEPAKPGTRIPLQGLRRRIAEHMVHAKRTAPHYSYVDECDVTDLVRLRDSLREPCTAAGIKLTYLAFFVKAVCAALEQVPLVNASLDETNGEIVLHDHYHIGVAVATPNGLIVPVIRDADRKDLMQIAREIERPLGDEARNGKSRLEDLRGGTFTVTSIGSIVGLISTPILNHPEVGILGIGKIVKRPVYDALGNIRPADLLYLSFSFDHRVVDGAVGAQFGNAVIQQVQNPATLLLPQPLG